MEEDRKERFFAVINDVGRAIHKLRVHQGLTQEEAAARMGVTAKKLDAVERGRLTTHLSTLTDYVESIGGSLAIVPTDNPGVDHCMFIAPSSQKTGAVPPPVKKPHPCTGCDHYRRIDSYCDFWKGTIDNSFKCTNQKTTNK